MWKLCTLTSRWSAFWGNSDLRTSNGNTGSYSLAWFRQDKTTDERMAVTCAQCFGKWDYQNTQSYSLLISTTGEVFFKRTPSSFLDSRVLCNGFVKEISWFFNTGQWSLVCSSLRCKNPIVFLIDYTLIKPNCWAFFINFFSFSSGLTSGKRERQKNNAHDDNLPTLPHFKPVCWFNALSAILYVGFLIWLQGSWGSR